MAKRVWGSVITGACCLLSLCCRTAMPLRWKSGWGKGKKLQSGEGALPNGCEASDKAEAWAAAMLHKG